MRWALYAMLKKPYAQTAHLVFANPKSNAKNQKSCINQPLMNE
jgi:hypothetical protein